jgi:death on curing protein
MSRIRPVTYDNFLYVFKYAQEKHSQKDEPIPQITTDNIPKIKSALNQPFSTFEGRYLYKGFASKAAILFYGIIAGHVLANGNKRMAILTLSFFCFTNSYGVKLTSEALEFMAKVVASPHDKDDVLAFIERTINKYRVRDVSYILSPKTH